MDFDGIVHYAQLVLEVFFVNLLLSGDNAVVIALACRSLPPKLARRAMLLGIEAAIAMRVLLTVAASLLMRIPMLQLVGGIALTVIAIRLTVERVEGAPADGQAPAAATQLWSAVGTVFVADLVMSIDNVVALAAVAKGSALILSIGLLMSVPFLLYGSLFVSALLRRYPLLKHGGGAMLGWLAGDIAISDPLVAGWVAQQSPALTVVVPVLVVVYVLYQSRIIEERLPKVRPQRLAARARPAPVMPRAIGQPRPVAPPAAPHEPPASPAPPASSAAPVARAARPRVRALPWIVVGLALLALWAFVHFLSLGDRARPPAIHWSTPVGTR